MNQKETLEFRFAKEEDTALVMQFIQELAEYEKLSDQVTVTEESLRKELFEKKAAEVLFAVEDGKEIGFALFFHNFSTFLGKSGLYLEDLFIRPENRGKGIGTEIFKRLAKIAKERGYGRMEWSCLNWNKPSIQFYGSMGAKAMDEWTVHRLTEDGIAKLAEA
ncbi:MAG: GNAT family N-acetyltransferase [Lachnospiraceae bacterium]|nr:GNAT family N-acetyltransferase [Lachnospiraceae bacterium]